MDKEKQKHNLLIKIQRISVELFKYILVLMMISLVWKLRTREGNRNIVSSNLVG